jgi:AraC-like DNA-binding protein
MLAIPIPFVIAILIALMLALLLRSDRDARPSWELVAFLTMAIVLSVLVGMRWSYGFTLVRFVLPVCASTVPPLVWMTVDALRRTKRSAFMSWLPLAAIVGAMLVLTLIHPPTVRVLELAIDPIDLYTTTVDLGFGIAVLRVAMSGPDKLDLARLGGASATQQAIFALGAVLVFNGVIDAIIAARVEGGPGSIGAIISVADLFALVATAWATVLVGWGRPMPAVDATEPAAADDVIAATDAGATSNEDLAVLDVVDALLRERLLYHDPDLTLDRLGRRAGLPARAISGAINRVHRMNVSQYVNGFRVAEAQTLLNQTDQPITAILYDVGFQTKSNFNREFRRVTGMSPSEWRNPQTPIGA